MRSPAGILSGRPGGPTSIEGLLTAKAELDDAKAVVEEKRAVFRSELQSANEAGHSLRELASVLGMSFQSLGRMLTRRSSR